MGFLLPLALITIFNLYLFRDGFAELIYEDGYTVTTVFDGNKLNINPHWVAPRPGSHDLLLLDSSNSVFYSLSLPLSQESVIKRFSGTGAAGFSDGDFSSAMFNKPRSFAMDSKGNVYVADRSNFAVRKISASGVTTIAGGHSKTPGRADGAGYNATFSADYELSYVPDMCALLVLDHGSKLIRQINLKHEDCGHSHESGIGVTPVWAVALVVSCLVGLLIGFAIRPFVMPHEELNLHKNRESWTCYLMNLGRQTQMHYFGTRSAVVSSRALKFVTRLLKLILSHLSLMLNFRMIKRVNSSSSKVHNNNHISLLDSENSSGLESANSQKYADQLRDLISFDKDPGTSNIMCNDVMEKDDDGNSNEIHDMIQANIRKFDEDARKTTLINGPFLGVSTIVKRK